MDNDYYTIDFDDAMRFMRITIRGYWNVAILNGYEKDLRQTINRILKNRGPFFVLSDIREHGVQSQEVAARIQILMKDRTIAPAKLAVLVSNGLMKIQASRLISEGQRVFVEEESALRWLFSDG